MIRKILASSAIAAAVVIGGAGAAYATNVDVHEDSGCTNNEWVMHFSAHNSHNAPLHVRLDTTQGPGSVKTLAPNATYATQFTGSSGPFTWTWSSDDGHLVGVTSGTFTRPEGCQPATTVPPATTIPPETTVPGPDTTVPPATTVPGQSAVTPPPDTAVVKPGPPVVNAPPDGPVVQVRSPLPATCFTQDNCPKPTDNSSQLWLLLLPVAIIGGVLIGLALVRHRIES